MTPACDVTAMFDSKARFSRHSAARQASGRLPMFRGRRDFQWFRRSHRRVNHPDNNMLQPPGLLAAHIGLLAPGPWQETFPAWLKKFAQRPAAIGVPIRPLEFKRVVKYR